MSLKKEESWYGIIQYKAAAGERIVPTLYGDEIMFFCQLQSPNKGTVKVLGIVVVWTIFTFDSFSR